MGMKLKSGADLCGFQLTNFCIQGEASAPSDAALGRKYFHTNATDDVATGISLLHRERIYLGEGAWRATAYLDDIAAIQTKLDMILGDVDLDGVIENMNEVIKFLEDNKDTENLMALLNNKLSTSGGTISTSDYPALKINREGGKDASAIEFSNSGDGFLGRIGVGGTAFTTGRNLFFENAAGNIYILIHSGNIGGYKAGDADKLDGLDGVQYAKSIRNALHNVDGNVDGLAGGKLQQGEGTFPISTAKNGPFLAFGHSGYQCQISSRSNRTWLRTQEANEFSEWREIAYLDSNVASATKLQTARTIWGKSFDGTGDVRGILSSVSGIDFTADNSNDIGSNTRQVRYIYAGWVGSRSGKTLAFGANNGTHVLINSSGNVTIGASDLAETSYKAYINGSTMVYAYTTSPTLGNKANNSLVVGTSNYGIQSWIINTGTGFIQNSRLNGTAEAFALCLQPLGGNVLIGTTTDDGNKLQVIGGASFRSTTSWQNERAILNYAGLKLYARDTGGYNQSISFLHYDGTIFAGLFAAGRRSLVVGTAQDAPWVTFAPDGVHITGNLIVDGEVSAGGAGAEEGTSGGGGSVDFHSEKFMPSTSTLKEVNHNLGKDVIVQVYEEGTVSDTWNLVMVDVEIVSATKLYLRFGKTENTYHKVVVMGAGV